MISQTGAAISVSYNDCHEYLCKLVTEGEPPTVINNSCNISYQELFIKSIFGLIFFAVDVPTFYLSALICVKNKNPPASGVACDAAS